MLHSVWHTLLPLQTWACSCLRVVNAGKFMEATSDQSIPLSKIALTNLSTSPPTQPTTNASFTCQQRHETLNHLLDDITTACMPRRFFQFRHLDLRELEIKVLKKHRSEFMQNSWKFHEVSWFSNMTLRQQHVTHWYPMARLNRLHSGSRQEEDSGALWVEHRPMSMSHWPRQHRCGSKTQRRTCCNTCSYLFNNSNSTQKYWLESRDSKGLTVHGCPAHHTQGCPKVFLPSSLKPTFHLL